MIDLLPLEAPSRDLCIIGVEILFKLQHRILSKADRHIYQNS